MKNKSQQSLLIASWNVNSVRRRQSHIEEFLKRFEPDHLLLQEIKCENDKFPAAPFADLGYTAYVHGQKAYHGVAILSRDGNLPTERMFFAEKPEARHIAVSVSAAGKNIAIHNVYAPSGGGIPDADRNPKFGYKLEYFRELGIWGEEQKDNSNILMGDLNIAPRPNDVWNHKVQAKYVGHSPSETALYNEVKRQGAWIDAALLDPADGREHEDRSAAYTWWTMRGKSSFESDKGWRLDHCWLSSDLAQSVDSFEVFRETRSWETPSDHAPILLKLTFDQAANGDDDN